jgi:hypothetical protein
MSSSFSLDAWDQLADRLELPRGSFGIQSNLDVLLKDARDVTTARDDMAYLNTAMRALRKLSSPPADVLERLEAERNRCHGRLALFPPKGSRRADAYFVAMIVSHAFGVVGRQITFGQSPDGKPSTPYCRAVMTAFEILGIEGTWRGPAKAAWVEHRSA